MTRFTRTGPGGLGEFGAHFEEDESGAGLRMTAAGARTLLPRLARHQLALANPATRQQVRDVLQALSLAEHEAGKDQLQGLLSRTDLSAVERDVLESLRAWQREPAAGLARKEGTATVIDLQAWKARAAQRGST